MSRVSRMRKSIRLNRRTQLITVCRWSVAILVNSVLRGFWRKHQSFHSSLSFFNPVNRLDIITGCGRRRWCRTSYSRWTRSVVFLLGILLSIGLFQHNCFESIQVKCLLSFSLSFRKLEQNGNWYRRPLETTGFRWGWLGLSCFTSECNVLFLEADSSVFSSQSDCIGSIDWTFFDSIQLTVCYQ